MISLRNITKNYYMATQTVKVLKGVDFSLADGEFVSIVGASGSGKSTLMNLVGMLDRPTSGEYFFHDREISQLNDDDMAVIRNKTIGFIFQQFLLLPRLSALDNVTLPLRYRNMPVSEQRDRAMAMLERVGVAELRNNKPSEMSGGQQQRVAIARALVGNPNFILADEPTGALDSKSGQDVMNFFLELNTQEKVTILLITHDNNIAKQCMRVVRMKDGHILPEDHIEDGQ